MKNQKIEDWDLKKILPIQINPLDENFSREMSSIFRSDLIILSSDFEYKLLREKFSLNNLLNVSFYYQEIEKMQNYEQQFELRKNFVFIGNFRHTPNIEAVRLLLQIWPQIQSKLPKVELHIYGSNFPKEFENINDIKGIKKKNLMKDISSLKKYRYLLSPLFYGAGVKGKITDSWSQSTPVITTPIGSEGLFLETYDDNFQQK